MAIRLIDIYALGGPDQRSIDVLYELLAERPPEANISHREMPTPEQHRQFVHRRPYEAWYFIEGPVGGGPNGIVGAAYLTKQREVGLFIFSQHRGKGHGRLALEELRRLHPGRILANVAPSNARSLRFFEAAGAKLIQYTLEL